MVYPKSGVQLLAKISRLTVFVDRREDDKIVRVPYRTILATIVSVVLTGLAMAFLWRIRHILVLVAIGMFVAAVLNPLVSMLVRRGFNRGVATTLVFLSCILLLVGIIYLFLVPAITAGIHFAETLPAYVKQAQKGNGFAGHLIRQWHLEKYVSKNASKLQSNLTKLGSTFGSGVLAVGAVIFSTAFQIAIDFAVVGVVALFTLLEAPRMFQGLLSLLSEDRQEVASRLADRMIGSVVGYVVGNLATSLIAGIVVFATLTSLGVPYAFVLGLWVALVDLLPLVGGLIAGVPTVLIALSHSLISAVVTLGVFLIYQQIENHFLNPMVMRKTMHLNPLWTLLAVLVGADILGFAGALLAIPLAGMIQVIAIEVWRGSKGRRAAGWLSKREPEGV